MPIFNSKKYSQLHCIVTRANLTYISHKSRILSPNLIKNFHIAHLRGKVSKHLPSPHHISSQGFHRSPQHLTTAFHTQCHSFTQRFVVAHHTVTLCISLWLISQNHSLPRNLMAHHTHCHSILPHVTLVIIHQHSATSFSERASACLRRNTKQYKSKETKKRTKKAAKET